ncbi:MAG TPA: HD domain-containing protein, partial [Terriglobales bacterium]
RENAEFTISLIDCRYLCGSRELFDKLHDTVVPQVIAREHQELVQRLNEINEDRHAKFSDTIFHLEPNIKDGPGGLRDFNIAVWLTQIQHFSRSRDWVDPKSQWALSVREGCERAYKFLATVRCFLHYRANRDENTLAWDAQEEAARRSLGIESNTVTSAAEWMRAFFREARVIYRISQQVLDDVPAQQSSLYKAFQSWRGRVSNADFSAVKNRVYLQQPSSIGDPDVLLRLFEFVAQHGIPLATSTERRIEQSMPQITDAIQKGGNWWPYLRNVLLRPHAGLALRAMHALGVLTLILPEFHYVDALVIRDLYHRYTVDEHTFAAIDSLHQVAHSTAEVERGYAGLFAELQNRELLMLALLLHDLGKGTDSENHVTSSAELARPVLERFALKQEEREIVLFLISAHLEMSSALRRDIFDVPSVRAFAHVVGDTERLKMLCLMTWADIRSVNPDALTPWKAENIWQLYIATANILNRSLDEERIHADREDESLARIRALAPRLGRRLKTFLEGLPQRYLGLHSAHEIMQHIELASNLQSNPVQTALKREGSLFQLTLVTMDKPMIFANVAGALASWGMNILKADAFSNSSGVVVDTFLFTDRFRTLELNVQEWERFQQVVEDVLSGRTTVEKLMQRRRPEKKKLHVGVETSVTLDDQSSPHSTLIEIITEDRPGLLYLVARRFSLQNC